MQPSSLIFVLVVAIWAVCLLQYWIKRRDHLSTVRSVDRFSAAMRVLDDHRLRRGTTEPTPRSYSVAPTRTARPEVTVKHADAPPRGRMVEPVVGASRRVRGLTLLTMLVLLPVVALVAAFGPLPWWVGAAWLVGTVAAFGWLRQAVRAEREARGRERVALRRAQAPAERAPAVDSAPAPAPRRRAERVYDVAVSDPTTAETVADDTVTAAAPTTPEPGTWEPAPVPRPVYAMKAPAHRPEPTPAATATPAAAQDEVPQVIDVEDEDLPAIAGWG